MVMAVPQLAPRPQVSIRVVRADGGPESVVRMTRDALTCGQQADIPLPDDPFVTPVQARFFFSGVRLAVEDVGGANGVFVRLRQERELPVGSELRLGRQRLVLEPIPAAAVGAGGAHIWGSPDPGYRLRLVQLLEGGMRGAAFPLKEGDNALGREIGDITFPTDGFVSGRHALLQVRQDRLMVRDLGSSNGTFMRLSGPSFVDNGDHFLIGRQLLRVEIQAAA
jgi:pSer/pThr/pTyr-binding forkhead associated (FHA) protein